MRTTISRSCSALLPSPRAPTSRLVAWAASAAPSIWRERGEGWGSPPLRRQLAERRATDDIRAKYRERLPPAAAGPSNCSASGSGAPREPQTTAAAALARAGARDELLPADGEALDAERDAADERDDADDVTEMAAAAGEARRAAARAELNLVAGEYFNVGLLPQAQEHFEQLATRVTAECGPAHPELAAVLNNLGMTRLHRGDIAGARADLAQALQLREVEAAAAGDETVLVSVLANAALAARRASDLDAAAQALERAGDILERLGSERPLYPVVLNNLGLVRHAQDQIPAALALFERAARVATQLLRSPARVPPPPQLSGHPVDTRPTAQAHVDQFTAAYASLFRNDAPVGPASPSGAPAGDAQLAALEAEAAAAERAETQEELRQTLATALGNAMASAARLGQGGRAEAHAGALVAELDREDTTGAEGGGPHPQLAAALRTLARAAVARRDCRAAVRHIERLQALQREHQASPADLAVTARWLAILYNKIRATA